MTMSILTSHLLSTSALLSTLTHLVPHAPRCRMDNVSRALIAPILADLRERFDTAARHSICGIPTDEDKVGIYRRVARSHGCTPPDVQRWLEAAQSEPKEETQA